MKIYANFQQKNGGDPTQEWIQSRLGKITASEFDRIVDSKGVLRKGEMPKTYLCEKLVERWTGREAKKPFFNLPVSNGIIVEEKAAAYASLAYGLEICPVGFAEADQPLVGCSPDGLVGWDASKLKQSEPTEFPVCFSPASQCSGIEIKSPELPAHVKYLLDGKLPPDYVGQVQGSMFVTGCSTWHFLSYPLACYLDGFPPFHIIVERDEEYQEHLSDSLATFLAQYEAAFARLVDMNGGPPPPRAKIVSPDELRQTEMEKGGEIVY